MEDRIVTQAQEESPEICVRPVQRARRVFNNQSNKKTHNPRRLLLQDSDDENSDTSSSRGLHSRTISDTTPTTPSFSEIMATLDDAPNEVSDRGDLGKGSPMSTAGLRRHSRVSSKRLSVKDIPRSSNLTDPDGVDSRRLSSISTLSGRRSLHRAPDSPMLSSTAFSSSFTSLVDIDGIPQDKADSIKMLRRRQAILRELVLTEISFSEDLSLVVNEYENKVSSCPALSAQDARQIFGGVEPVLFFSSDFATELQTAVSPVLFSEAVNYETLLLEDANTNVGVIFGQFMVRLSKVFSNYCSTHEKAAASLQRVAEVPAINQWLADRHPADRTTAWDLPSLLIKPVQRILKYPLLLSTLLQATPRTHPDYYTIELALKEMLLTAENINNIKKRRDLMGNIAAERKKSNFDLQTNIAKTFSRRATKVKQTIGIEEVETTDSLYDSLAKSFSAQEALLQTLHSEISEWLIGMKSSLEYHAAFSRALRDLELCQDAPVSSFVPVIPWQEYSTAIADLQQGSFVELTHNLEREVFQPLSMLEKAYNNPKILMQERDRNADDFHRSRTSIAQGTIPEKTVSDGADRYSQLNDTLIQDLPRFLNISRKAMTQINLGLASVQKSWYESWQSRLKQLLDPDGDPKDIKGHFRERYAIVQEFMENFTLVSPPVYKPVRFQNDAVRSSEDSASTCDTSIKSDTTKSILSRVVASSQRRPSLRERASSAANSAQISLRALTPVPKTGTSATYEVKVDTR